MYESSKGIKQQIQQKNVDEMDQSNIRKINEKESGQKMNQGNNGDSSQLKLSIVTSQNHSTLLHIPNNAIGNNNSSMHNLHHRHQKQQIFCKQQQQQHLQGINQGNTHSHNGSSQKMQMNSPTRRFAQNTKPLHNGQQKKTYSFGNMQQQVVQNIGIANDSEEVNSPLGPSQISAQINNSSGFQMMNSQISNMIQSTPSSKVQINRIDLEDSNGQHDKDYFQSNQSDNFSAIDKSPQFKQQTKFPPITKGQSTQNINTNHNKLQKIKVYEKEVRKNIVALDSISRVDMFNGSQANNNLKIVKPSQQSGLYNQLNKALQDGNANINAGNVQQLELDIKSGIPHENPHYYPTYKVKRANQNNKLSRDFQNKDNGDHLLLEVVNSKSTHDQLTNNLQTHLYNSHQSATTTHKEQRENKFIELNGGEKYEFSEMNRSSSTPMLLKRDMPKILDKIKHHNTNEGGNSHDDNEQSMQQNNRFEKVISNKISSTLASTPSNQNQIKHVVTIQKKEKSKLNLNKFDDSDRENDTQQLNPIIQKKYPYKGANIVKGKQISAATAATTNLKPIKIYKKQIETDQLENQKENNGNNSTQNAQESISMKTSNIHISQKSMHPNKDMIKSTIINKNDEEFFEQNSNII